LRSYTRKIPIGGWLHSCRVTSIRGDQPKVLIYKGFSDFRLEAILIFLSILAGA